MALLDWIVSIIFLGVILLIGFLTRGKASESSAGFFVADRKLPWWLAGMSSAATSFASDSPLHMSAMTRRAGFLGCWFYFQQIFGMVFDYILFGKLWRRSFVITELEFYKLRHGGTAASVLRTIMAIYQGLIIAPLRIATFILGMNILIGVLFDLDATLILPLIGVIDSGMAISLVLVAVALVYSSMSGLVGVAWTDFIEFCAAMVGTYVLMFIGLEAVGGLESLRIGVEEIFAAQGNDNNPFSIIPGWGDVLTYTFIFYISSFAIGPLAGGSGAAAQRMLACRSERDATLSGIFNVIVTFVVRFMPWFMIGFISLVLYPDLANHEEAAPYMIAELLPAGLVGLMFIAFFSAFLSSIDSFLNLGASWVQNDLVRPFTDRSERFYVLVGKLATFLIAALGILLASYLTGILDAIKLIATFGIGYGIFRILRWFWWRVNTASEISAIVVSLVLAMGIELGHRFGYSTPSDWILSTLSPDPGNFPLKDLEFAVRASFIAGVTIIVSFIVMFLTPPDKDEVLNAFYRKLRPAGPGWRRFARANPDLPSPDSLSRDGFGILLGLCFCFAFLFGAAKFFTGAFLSGLAFFAVGFVCFLLLNQFHLRTLKGTGDDEESERSGTPTSGGTAARP